MKRREFMGGVGAAVAVALVPLPALGPIAAPMTAAEVTWRQTVFQRQFQDEFLHQFENMRALNRMVDQQIFMACNPPIPVTLL